jgi:hypothetical protein
MSLSGLELYDAVKSKMDTGDVIAWHTHSLVSSAIMAFTKGEFSHVSGILRLRECEVGDRRFHSEATPQGILPNLLSHRLDRFDGEVYWYPLKEEFGVVRNVMAQRMSELFGVGYDYATLTKMAVADTGVDEAKLICSEYVQLYLARGVEALGGVPDFMNKVLDPQEVVELTFYKERVRIL